VEELDIPESDPHEATEEVVDACRVADTLCVEELPQTSATLKK
jgi:hypothetical protein